MLAIALFALFIGAALASAAVLADSGLRGVTTVRRLRGELRMLDRAIELAPRQRGVQMLVIRAASPRRAQQGALPALRAAA